MLIASRTRRIVGMVGTVGVTLLAVPTFAQAQITFDELAPGNYLGLSNPYQNFRWFFGDAAFGQGAGNALQYSTLGAACFSASNCAYNANGNTPMRIESLTSSSPVFTFAGYLAAGYPGFSPTAVTVLAQGFIGSSAVAAFSQVLTLGAGGAFSLFDLSGQVGVNKILLTPRDAQGAGPTGFFRLDNVTLGAPVGPPSNVVPEPSTIVLLAGGLGALAWASRRRAARR